MDEIQHPWLSRLAILYGLGVILVLAGPIPLAGALAVLIVVPALEWVFGTLDEDTRAHAFRLLRALGLPLLIIAASIVVKNWPLIARGQLVGPAAVLALVFLATLYVLVGIYPAAIGRWLAASLRGGLEPTSWWELSEAVSRRRAVFRWLFAGLVIALAATAAGLLSLARAVSFPHVSPAWLVLATLALLGGIAALAWTRAQGLGWPALPDVDDASTAAVARRAVEGVAIAAGVERPAVRVVAHQRPTAFTVSGRSGPTVIVTSGLVSLIAPGELEAVAAHEVGHIASGGADDSQTIEALLDLLRLLGAAVLILYLIATRATVDWPWAVLIAAFLAGGMIDQASYEWDHRPGRFAEATVVLINPAMVMANVLAYVFYFALGQDEDLLADLRAAELTHNPGALHAALRRIRDADVGGPLLPVAYQFRYFTAEGTLPEGFPSAQASIETRLATLERIEPDLRVDAALRPRVAECPDCGQPLTPLVVASHYGAPIHVDRCTACGGIWFDDLELYLTGARELIQAATGQPPPRPHEGAVECPRCRAGLKRMPTLGMPADISVWECPACRGAWVRSPDLAKFGAFRQRREDRRTRPVRSLD